MPTDPSPFIVRDRDETQMVEYGTRMRRERDALQKVVDRCYTLLIEDAAAEKSDRQLLAEIRNKLADVAT